MIDFDAAKESLKELVEKLVLLDNEPASAASVTELCRLYAEVAHALAVGKLAHATLDRMVGTMFDPALLALKERLTNG